MRTKSNSSTPKSKISLSAFKPFKKAMVSSFVPLKLIKCRIFLQCSSDTPNSFNSFSTASSPIFSNLSTIRIMPSALSSRPSIAKNPVNTLRLLMRIVKSLRPKRLKIS